MSNKSVASELTLYTDLRWSKLPRREQERQLLAVIRATFPDIVRVGQLYLNVFCKLYSAFSVDFSLKSCCDQPKSLVFH